MSWRETWRETVGSFLREVREPGEARAGSAGDPVVEAIGAVRREITVLEHEVAAVSARVERERLLAEDCVRRQALARRIGDGETAAIAERFGARHGQRAAVLERKQAVLRDELTLARASLNDLLDLVRVEPGPS